MPWSVHTYTVNLTHVIYQIGYGISAYFDINISVIGKSQNLYIGTPLLSTFSKECYPECTVSIVYILCLANYIVLLYRDAVWTPSPSCAAGDGDGEGTHVSAYVRVYIHLYSHMVAISHA